MKIKKEHLEYIQSAINKVLDANPSIVADYESGNFVRSDSVKDLQRRFCFDLHYMAGLTPWVCKEIYSYANDDHLYTALRRACPKVTRRYTSNY